MDRPLNEKELADYLGVSHEWVRLRVKRREIPFTRLPDGKGDGKLVRFTATHVADILAAGEQPALNGPLARPLRSVPTPEENAA